MGSLFPTDSENAYLTRRPPRRLGTLRPDHSGALIGTGANNCKLIVVKPEKRDGYMPDPLITQSFKEAPKHGVPIEGITVPARERPES